MPDNNSAFAHALDQQKEELGAKVNVPIISEEQANASANPQASTPAQNVDLQGWDCVSAMTFDVMNEAIKKQHVSPPNFEMVDDSAKVSGTFGDWQLDLDGDGKLIALLVPIPTIAMQFMGKNLNAEQAFAQIQVQAKYLPFSMNPLVPTNSQLTLTVDYASEKPVHVENFYRLDGSKSTDVFSDSIANDVAKSLLEKWFNESRVRFVPIFAIADLEAGYSSPAQAWLKPSATGYAVVSPNQATMKNSLFGVLDCIDGRMIEASMPYQMSPYVMPDGCDAVFAISPTKFLKHMLFDAVPYMFSDDVSKQPASANFASFNLTSIQNTQEIKMHAMEVSGSTVSPKVQPENFRLSVDGSYLVLDIQGAEFPIDESYTGLLTYQARFQMTYVNGQILLTESSRTATLVPQETSFGKDFEIGFIIATIALAIVGGVAGAAAWVRAAAPVAEVGAGVGEVAGVTAGSVRAFSALGYGGEAVEESTSGILSGLKAMRLAGGLKLAQLGVPFGTIAKIAVGGGTIVGVAGGGLDLYEHLDKNGLNDQQVEFTKSLQDAIAKTVIWPNEAGKFDLNSVGLNGALQFGFVRTKANG